MCIRDRLATLFVAYGGLILVLATGSYPALGLDLQGGISVTKQPKSSNFSSAALDLTVERLRERVDSLGVDPLAPAPVSYTHLRAHETVLELVCRLLLEKTKHST